MIYNIDFSIAGSFIFLALYLSMRFQFDIDTKANLMFRHVVVTAFLSNLMDMITAITISYPHGIPLWAHYVLNIIFFEMGSICVYCLPVYIRYLIDPEKGKKSIGDRINEALLAIYIIICFTTPWTHLVIYFDENMQYMYGPLHSILYLAPIYYFAFGMIRLMVKRSLFTKKQIRTIISFIIVAFMGPLIQMIFVPSYLISYFAVSIASLIVVFGIESPDYIKLLNTMNELEKSRDLLEIAKKEEEEKSKTIHELTKAASWYISIDKDFNLTGGDWSREFFWMLGYEKEEFGEEKYNLWEQSLHPDDHDLAMQSFAAGMAGTAPFDMSYRLKSKNGEYKWYRGTGETKTDAITGYVTYRGIIQDINDEKIKEDLAAEKLAALEELEKSQAALKTALVKAESADRAKSDFLARMSHEIRTPINAILGMNELITRESSESGIKSYSGNITSAGNTLLSLVNDILDFSKIEAGRMEISPSVYEVYSLIEETNNLVRMRCMEKGLKFIIKNNPNIPRKLRGDEVRIRQILVNLLTNAVKYSETGTVELIIDYEPKDDSTILLKVDVSDTGIGIKEEDINILFDVFKRVESEHNHKTEGTGLGLNITKSFVELMGGNISVSSVYGKGSIFSICIPQEVKDATPLGTFVARYNGSAEKYKAKIVAPDARALVVDDIKINLKVAKGLLKETQIIVDTAQSGSECLEMIRNVKYDIIFLDHMMPEMDGIETFKKLKADNTHLNTDTPIIMLTANAIMGAKEEYLDSGFDAYMSKPIRVDELEAMLLKFIPEEKRV